MKAKIGGMEDKLGVRIVFWTMVDGNKTTASRNRYMKHELSKTDKKKHRVWGYRKG